MTTTPSLDLARLNAVTDAAISGSSEFFKDNSSLTKMHNCLSKNELFSAAFNPQTARLLLDRIEQLENPWQPIETAPKDGTHIMLTDGQQVLQGWWMYEEPYTREMRDMDGHYVVQAESDGYDDWFDCEGGSIVTPTHWMPLPAAPKLEQTK